MERLYSSPLRVYLCLGLLAAVGLYSGAKLPTSLFPNSSKPVVGVWIPYGGVTAQEFQASDGAILESQLSAIAEDEIETDELSAGYEHGGAYYKVSFKWGAPALAAQREVRRIVDTFSNRLPEEARRGVGVWAQRSSEGFLALSFFSKKRSLDDLYSALEPLLSARLSRVPDASEAVLWNPESKEIGVTLRPDALARLQLLPSQVTPAINASLSSFSSGSMTVGPSDLPIVTQRWSRDIETLRQTLVVTPSGSTVHLSDVARVEERPKSTDKQSFKTNGTASLILFASPKPGGNVRRMAEDVLKVVREAEPSFPADVEYRVLVDPSEFIRAAVSNVMHEVILGALLAVAVLFLFIGSLRNVATAAIEIPLSMVLAFILMRMSGMNLNLVSLGGLALSAGMNVDGSVVVMENIFRHFGRLSTAESAALTPARRLKILCAAVAEVRFPVIASTIASLVVFLPLAFTSDLPNAVLGDLAKTVVFSHGLSAIVALILVPTVRLQLMARFRDEHPRAPAEGMLTRLENLYVGALGVFLERPRLRQGVYAGLAATLAALLIFALPRLPREVIGTPDTDWVVLNINTEGNTVLRQMETQAEITESELLKEFGADISYTFNQIRNVNQATLMARLKDKGRMMEVWKALEKRFVNTPYVRYYVSPWNPAEMPIPDPSDLRVAVRGGTPKDRAFFASRLTEELDTAKALPRVWAEPSAKRREGIVLSPNLERLQLLRARGFGVSPGDLADLVRISTEGRWIGSLPIDGRNTDIVLSFPEGTARTPEELGAFPLGVDSRVIPLKALADVRIEELPTPIYRENQKELFVVSGRKNKGDSRAETAKGVAKAERIVARFVKRENPVAKGVTIHVEDAQKELNDALWQLAAAVGLSIVLIFITMVFQFGGVLNALLVLAAVPLGIIGVLISLTVFKSTLSLNSVLGVILLNGLAVANSIILVDFLKRRFEEGVAPRAAALEAGRERLRPILITSITTLLGMGPIALGLGEGGRILQPLGIAVAGGLWFSMLLTLFVVPALQVSALEWLARRRTPRIVTEAEPELHLGGFPAGGVS